MGAYRRQGGNGGEHRFPLRTFQKGYGNFTADGRGFETIVLLDSDSFWVSMTRVCARRQMSLSSSFYYWPLIVTLSKTYCLFILYRRKMKLEPYKQYGLLVDGTSMTTALQHYPELLKTVGMACEAVVCCRLTPLQKSEVKKKKKEYVFSRVSLSIMRVSLAHFVSYWMEQNEC